MKFIECGICITKTGQPVLCPSCLHNRDVIEKLTAKVSEMAECSNKVGDILSNLTKVAYSLGVEK